MSASAKSGTKILEVWDLQILRGSDRLLKIVKWQADLALADRTHVLQNQNGHHKTQKFKHTP